MRRLLCCGSAALTLTFAASGNAFAADPATGSFLRLSDYGGTAEQVITLSADQDLFGTVGSFNGQPDLFISSFNFVTGARRQITLVPPGGAMLAPGTYENAGGFGDWPGRAAIQVLHHGPESNFSCDGGSFTVHSLTATQLFDVSWTQTCEGRPVSGRAVFRDTAAPLIFFPAGEQITLAAQRPEGAIVGYEVQVVDNLDPNPQLSCSHASGELFPIGITAVSCTATDAAGNSASASFTVHVLSGAEILASLRDLVAALTPDPYGRVLLVTLDRAQRELAAGSTRQACAALEVFGKQAEAFAQQLPDQAALLGDMVFVAEHIRFVLAC